MKLNLHRIVTQTYFRASRFRVANPMFKEVFLSRKPDILGSLEDHHEWLLKSKDNVLIVKFLNSSYLPELDNRKIVLIVQNAQETMSSSGMMSEFCTNRCYSKRRRNFEPISLIFLEKIA